MGSIPRLEEHTTGVPPHPKIRRYILFYTGYFKDLDSRTYPNKCIGLVRFFWSHRELRGALAARVMAVLLSPIIIFHFGFSISCFFIKPKPNHAPGPL